MPELPEVETMRRGLRPIIGFKVVDVLQPACGLRPILITPNIREIKSQVINLEIRAVGRRGKRVLIQFCNDSALVFEPRMTGLVLLADPPTTEHLRFCLDLSDEKSGVQQQLLFWDRRGLGTVRLLDAEEIQLRLGLATLGPDALEITLDDFRSNFATSSRPIKVALLDQKRIAGIGNLYASELLHVAGVDPRTRCDRLSGPQWQRVYTAMRLVLEEAIRYEGSTLSDGTYRNALNKAGGYQNFHRVYDRHQQVCPRCRTATIQRIVQAQRSTFFCPGCQRRRGKHESVGLNSLDATRSNSQS